LGILDVTSHSHIVKRLMTSGSSRYTNVKKNVGNVNASAVVFPLQPEDFELDMETSLSIWQQSMVQVSLQH
jgi:hypothetical protein